MAEKRKRGYTPIQVQALRDNAPITRALAESFAIEWCVTARSVISKSVLLGIYQKAELPVRKTNNLTKAQIVADIEERLHLHTGALNPLSSKSNQQLLLDSLIALELMDK